MAFTMLVLLVILHLALCFFPSSGPMMLRIMVGMLQKDSCPRRTGTLDYFRDDVVFFYGPLYLEITCSRCLPEEYRVASFPGDDSRNGFRIQHSSWFNSGYTLASVYEAFWNNFTRSLLDMIAENCGVSAVAVHCWSSFNSFRGAQADSHGPVQKTIEIQYIDKVIDGVLQVQQIRALLWETVEIPQLQLVECLGQVVDILVVAQLQFPWSSRDSPVAVH